MTIPLAWFGVAWTVWLLSELVGAILIPSIRRSRAGIVVRQRADRGSAPIIVLGVFVALVSVSVFSALGLADLPLALGFVGAALVAIGIGLRQWSIAVLGAYFSPSVRVVADHQVVTAGPYRYVRHPSYTGALIALVGLGLLGGSWEGTLMIVGIAAVVFGYRIHVEEKVLSEQLGAEYTEYRSRTKRLIPFVI
jgi:protein-S-isoprenylcysteine O-methyltransferase Ste14